MAYGWIAAPRRQLTATQRRAILDRDNHTCRSCGGPGNHVDHILNQARGGSNEPPNLQTLCARCHRQKTNKEAAAGRRGHGYQRNQREPEPHPGRRD